MDRALECLVGERGQSSAAIADDVVVVLASGNHGLEAGAAVADLDPLDETLAREQVERAIDARNPGAPAAGAQSFGELLSADAAVLLRQQLDHGPARTPGPPALGGEGSQRQLRPGSIRGPGHGASISVLRMIIILASMDWIVLPFALATVAATFAGGALALRLAHSLPTLMALTGGVVVAVAIFDVLPESIEAVDDPQRVALLVGAGFIFFFLAERVLVLHHRDDPEQARSHAQVGALGALGLSAHSFIDGLGIGLAFGLDTATGVLVFIAVISHDFADGLNTVSFVLSQSDDRRRAKRWLTVDAFAPLFGALVGSAITISEFGLGQLLAVYVGFFLYMGATDLLPEAHGEHASWARVALTVAGFVAVLVVSRIAGH